MPLPEITPERLADRSFWQGLAPQLHIEEFSFSGRDAELASEPGAVTERAERMVTEGYFEIESAYPTESLAGLAQAVTALSEHSVPTVFAFVYDEFWLPYLQLGGVLRDILDPGYRRLPDFWAWRVDHRNSESGWGPHRDRNDVSLFSDGRPKAVTVWISLTNADPLNGCLYIVPADRDPGYARAATGSTDFYLQDVRAVPAVAGTAVVWNTHVMHWGARASRRASAPRISMSMEFQCSTETAMDTPLADPGEIPSFETRLRLIERQIERFSGWYAGPRASELELWGNALRAHFDIGPKVGRPEEGPPEAAQPPVPPFRRLASKLHRLLTQ